MDNSSYTAATMSFVVPHIPGFVKRRVPQFAVFKPVPPPIANSGRPRSVVSEAVIAEAEPPPSYAETLAPFFVRRFQRKADDRIAAPIDPAVETRDADAIEWKYANQGVSLLSLATQESAGGPTTPFTRQVYIHALTYLLRALPLSLNEEEQISLSAAIPEALIPQPTYQDYSGLSPCEEFPEYTDMHPYDQSPSASPSLLYRLTAKATVQFFVAISVILPWIQLCATKIYHFNRRHHVTERLFNTTLNTADLSRRAVWGLGTTLLSVQDGRVARLLENLLSWTVQSLSGGVYDGVGEGMAVLGLRGQQQQQRPQSRQGYYHPHPHQQQQHYRSSPAMGYRPAAHSRGHSRNLSQQSLMGYDWQQPQPVMAQQQQQQQQSRARAGSLRVVASSSSAVTSGAAGPSERTLRKARSHEVMRGAAPTGSAYSPAGKSSARMRPGPGLRRVEEGGGYA